MAGAAQELKPNSEFAYRELDTREQTQTTISALYDLRI
jgi:hypothetical protein